MSKPTDQHGRCRLLGRGKTSCVTMNLHGRLHKVLIDVGQHGIDRVKIRIQEHCVRLDLEGPEK